MIRVMLFAFAAALVFVNAVSASNTSKELEVYPVSLLSEGKGFCIPKVIAVELDVFVAPIQQREDIQRYRSVNQDGNSPLGLLSPKARETFLQGLTFNEKGISGFRYDVLEEELSLYQAYQVLALIGQQRKSYLLERARVESALDHSVLDLMNQYQIEAKCSGGNLDGYRCASRATCTRSMKSVCLSSC